MNSPQIYWFSRRYLPFVFILTLFGSIFIKNNKKINILLMFILIAQIISNNQLVNFSGLKKTLLINKNNFNSNKIYFYDDTIDYRRNLSFFQNIYKIKVIPVEQIDKLKLLPDEYLFLTKNDCDINYNFKIDEVKFEFNEIIHNNIKFNVFFDKIPSLPKKYFKRNYKINICK